MLIHQASEPRPGDLIAGRYRVLERLGEGGAARVFLAEHVHLPGQRMAVKLLRTSALAPDRERFLREARLLLSLVHPGIVTIRDVFDDGGTLGFAMDHVAGPTLARALADGGPLAPERAAARAIEVLEALEAAHEAGVVHRDLKPANLMLADAWSTRERARVVDFGIAKLVRAAGSASRAGRVSRRGGASTGDALLGSPAYLSPEQAAGAPVDARADIYALGCVLFAMCCGRPPFLDARPLALAKKHIDSPPPRFADAAPRRVFPEGLEAAVRRALEKEPGRRWRSAREMREALAPFADASQAPPATTPTSTSMSTSVPVDPGEVTRDVGDPEVGSRGDRLEAAPTPAAITIQGRARLALPPGLSLDGLRTLYVIAGPRLRFGRSKPGQTPAARENNLVLRVLPCRGERLDPESFRATQGISSSHATIEARERGGGFAITDHSRGGTWLDGVRLEAGKATALPERFRLRLFDALELRGRCGGGVWIALFREANARTQGYLWVRGRAEVGAGADAAIRVARGSGEVAPDGDGLRLRLPAEVGAGRSEIGDEAAEEAAGAG